MALKTDLYLFPLINKFRDAFAEAFSFADRDGLTLIETVKSHTADGAEVTFSVRNWIFNTPNTWCGGKHSSNVGTICCRKFPFTATNTMTFSTHV